MQFLAKEYHYTPEQIGNMTLGEIAALMEDPERSSGLSDADIDDHGKWWASLTPAERLKNAERGW